MGFFSVLGDAWSGVKSVALKAWNGVKSTPAAIWGTIKNTAGAIKKAAVSGAKGLGKALPTVAHKVEDITKTLYNDAKTIINKLLDILSLPLTMITLGIFGVGGIMLLSRA